MELWVGQCGGETVGDAETGWNSVSRIMIEEVSRPHPNNGSLELWRCFNVLRIAFYKYRL